LRIVRAKEDRTLDDGALEVVVVVAVAAALAPPRGRNATVDAIWEEG